MGVGVSVGGEVGVGVRGGQGGINPQKTGKHDSVLLPDFRAVSIQHRIPAWAPTIPAWFSPRIPSHADAGARFNNPSLEKMILSLVNPGLPCRRWGCELSTHTHPQGTSRRKG